MNYKCKCPFLIGNDEMEYVCGLGKNIDCEECDVLRYLRRDWRHCPSCRFSKRMTALRGPCVYCGNTQLTTNYRPDMRLVKRNAEENEYVRVESNE